MAKIPEANKATNKVTAGIHRSATPPVKKPASWYRTPSPGWLGA
ncbi:hypothetical protein [Streptomyces sp. NPDC058463]